MVVVNGVYQCGKVVAGLDLFCVFALSGKWFEKLGMNKMQSFKLQYNILFYGGTILVIKANKYF